MVNKALQEANLSIADVDAIAVTNRPGTLQKKNQFSPKKNQKYHFFVGIDRSLTIGIRYAKHLARTYSKPLIPIHHMEAHALTARLQYNTQLSFPFLCLLASGGHCQLTLVKDVTDFVLIGESLDSAPGSCLDRVARALRLQILPEYRHLSGGKAIEMAAYKSTNSNRYHFSVPLLEYRNCQFSFDGLRGAGIQMIEEIRNRQRIASDEMIPYYEDFCASFLKIITKHLLQRTQRAIQYCDRIGAFGFGNNKLAKSFVFAGGVAANDFIYKAMSQMVTQFGFQTFRCSKKLCADNGVMIAWNGIERWSHDQNIYRQLNIDSVLPDCFARLGIDHSEFVTKKHLKCDFVKVPCMETKQIVSD